MNSGIEGAVGAVYSIMIRRPLREASSGESRIMVVDEFTLFSARESLRKYWKDYAIRVSADRDEDDRMFYGPTGVFISIIPSGSIWQIYGVTKKPIIDIMKTVGLPKPKRENFAHYGKVGASYFSAERRFRRRKRLRGLSSS